MRTYRLDWPPGWKRTQYRMTGAFKVDRQQAFQELKHELELLGAKRLVITEGDKKDPGVAVYFVLTIQAKSHPFVIASDRFSSTKANARAIGLTVSAMRAIKRHGASDLLERAFQGFKSLPPGEAGDDSWWSVLDCRPDSTPDEVKRKYRELSALHHPDKAGGNTEKMKAINAAYQEATR